MSDGGADLTPEQDDAATEAALKKELAAGLESLEQGEFTDVDDRDLDRFLESLAIERFH